jgi:hypothetical protein
MNKEKQNVIERIKVFSSDRIKYLVNMGEMPTPETFYIVFEEELNDLIKEDQ